MNTPTIIIGLLILLGLYFIWSKFINEKTEPDTDTTRPSADQLPKQEVSNDKLVIIDNASKTEVDSILTGFCNMYNKKSFEAQPRLYALSENQFAVTFPYDIEFEIYCYFVNYVHYPMGFDKSFNVTGWATTKSGQTWIAEKGANKRVMLFIPEDDAEHDNVYLTTSDNIGFKLGFSTDEEKQLLDLPKSPFRAPEIDTAGLAGKKFTDYK